MKTIITASLCIVNSFIVSSKEFSINDIPLKWKDFSVKEGFKSHPFDAKIITEIPYRFEIKTKDNSRLLSFQSEVKIDQGKSWVKKEFLNLSNPDKKDQLLNHEKGHLIIALIQHRKLQKLMSGYKFSRNPKKEIDSLYKIVLTGLSEQNEQYDLETNHMNNHAKQKEWIDRLIQEFNTLYANDNSINFKSDLQVKIE